MDLYAISGAAGMTGNELARKLLASGNLAKTTNVLGKKTFLEQAIGVRGLFHELLERGGSKGVRPSEETS